MVALIAYSSTGSYGAVWDDTTLLQPAVLGAAWGPLPFSDNYFRPLGVLSLATEARLFAEPLAAHHLINAALHALNTALVALLLGRHLREPGGLAPALLALLYALHPALVEGVAFISCRFDLLLTTGLLLAVLAELRLPGPWQRPLGVGLAFLLAALSKEAAAAFPLALLGGHLAAGIAPRQRLSSYAAVLLAGLAYLGLRYAALGTLYRPDQLDTLAVGAPLSHLLLVARSLERYLLLVVWPHGSLTPVHHAVLPLAWSAASARALLTGVLALGGLAWLVRRHPAVGGWLLAGLALLLPALNLVPLQLTGGAFAAERYLLAPLAFLALGAGVALRPWLSWERAPLAVGGLALWLAAAMVTVQDTLPRWRSSEALWAWGLEVAPRSSLPPINLSELHNRGGAPALGLQLAQEAIRREPEAALGWNNRGQAEFLLGDPAAAVHSFTQATVLEPQTAYFWSNLGAALQESGRLDEAEAVLLQHALPLDPSNPDAALNLAGVYLKAGRVDRALEQIEGVLMRGESDRARALQQEAAQPAAWLQLADQLRDQGALAEALQTLDRAEALGAHPADLAASRSAILIVAGRPAEAADLLRAAIAASPDDARLPYNMGIAALSDGATEDARVWLRRAADLDPAWDAPRQQLATLPPPPPTAP